MLPEHDDQTRRRGAQRHRRAMLACAAVVSIVALTGCGYAPTPVDPAAGQSTPTPGDSPTPSTSPSPSPSPSPTGGGGGGNGGGDSGGNGGGNGGGGGGGNGGGGGGGSQPPTVVYSWALPPTDISPSDNEGPAYASLRSSCESAAQYLDDTSAEKGITMHGFQNPRYVVLFYAGLALCRGETGRARSLTDNALARYSAGGLDRSWQPRDPATGEFYSPPRPPGYGEAECDLYRTLRSVLEQIAPDVIDCPGGAMPQFTWEEYPVTRDGVSTTVRVYDDPLTFDVDESLEAPPDPTEGPDGTDGADDTGADDGTEGPPPTSGE